MAYREFQDDQVEELIKRLAEGEPITYIGRDPRMPSADTILRWEQAGDELSKRITRARELGADFRAAQAMERAMNAQDPVKGRLAFDAERWWLSKVAHKRYGDKVALTGEDGGAIKHEHQHRIAVEKLSDAALKEIDGIAPPDDC